MQRSGVRLHWEGNQSSPPVDWQRYLEHPMATNRITFSGVPSGFVYYLEATAVDGIRVPSMPLIERRSVDIDINANIDIAIDLTKITATVAAAWLLARWQKLQSSSIPHSSNPTININGHQTRIDHAEIVERLENKLNGNDDAGNPQR